MKTYQVEVQRIKAMRHAGGTVELLVDAQVQPAPASADGEPATRLQFTEENARVLYALLRGQLTEIDRRKGRSQR